MAQAIFSDQYDWKLVALSIVVALCASYTTVELTGRSVGSGPNRKSFWLTGGALCIGVGLWAVQNLALLAFNLPAFVPERASTLGGSLLIAIIGSALALLAVGRRPFKNFSMLNGSVVLGGGLSALLYSAVQGLWLGAGLLHTLSLSAVSLLISLAAAFVAFQPGRWQPESSPDADKPDPEADSNPTPHLSEKWISLSSAIVMAVAIASIQYAGMTGVDFRSPVLASAHHVTNSYEFSSKIVIVTAALLLNVFGLSLLFSAVTKLLINQRGALHSEQERWGLVISANQDGLFDFDLISGEIFYSPRWKEIIGYSPDELDNTLETWQHRIHPEDKELVDSAIEKYLASKQGSGEVAYRIRHRDGSYRWILARSQAVWDSQGQALRLVGSNCDITERKQTSEALIASESRFSVFMELNPSLAFIKNSAGQFVYTNPTLEKAWKLKPGEWIGRSNHEVWPEPLAQRITESDREVLSAKVRSEMIEEFEMPDGQTRQFLTTRFSFPEADGRRAMGGVSVDITERLLMEEQLRSSESRYWELFEYNPLPSWIYRTRDLRILNVNQAAIDHYGWTRNQFLNLTVRSLLSPEEAESPEPEVKRQSPAYRKIKPVRHRRNKKSDIWVEQSSHEFEARGSVLRLVMATDVTDRLAFEHQIKNQNEFLEAMAAQRTAELEARIARHIADIEAAAAQRAAEMEERALQRAAELEANEAKWHNLVEALPEIVWSARPDGFCDYISRQLADYTGVPTTALIGWGWLRFVHASDRERVRSAWSAAAERSADYQVEYRIRSKAGPYRWFVTRGRSVRSSDGKTVTHWLGTTSDIQDQKRNTEHLETVVAEHTLALESARDQSEGEARSKGELIASIGQEILTPMNNVMGMTNLILHTSLTAEQRAYIDTVRSSSNSLVKVLNDVFDFSKVESATEELADEEFDLQAVLEDAVEALASSATEKGIPISLNVRDGVPFHARGDGGRLRQVLLNLLSNAVKFTREGSVSLSVSSLALDGQSMTLRFGVQDTGIGLSTEQQASLFQPTQDTDPPLMGATGLAIARRMVALIGGDIGVISKSGEGSTFWFSVRMLSVATPLPAGLEALAGKRVLLLTSPAGPVVNIGRFLRWAKCEVLDQEVSGVTPVSLLIADGSALKGMSQTAWQRLGRCPVLVVGSPAESSGLLPVTHAVEYVPQPARCLPLLKAAARLIVSAAPAQPLPPETPKRAKLQPGGAEILLVEDDHVNQLITTMFLAKMGHHVTAAGSGKEACAAIERQSYDLILMDCQMPEMDGFQATRLIREKERSKENNGHHQTPIIALSNGVLKEERDRCRAAGMDDFLSKPIEKEQLEAALSTWLNRAKVSATG